MKKILTFIFIALVGWPMSAQTLTDLESRLYQDLEMWEIQGYLHQLPMIKPYSGVVLSSLLKEAEQTGSFEVKEKARQYRQAYLSPVGSPHWEFKQNSVATNESYLGISQLNLQERGMIGELVSVDAELTGILIHGTASDSLSEKKANAGMSPAGQNLGVDYFVDKTQVIVKGQSIAATGNYSSLFGIGNESFSGQFGYTRTSFLELNGDALAVSPQAYKAPHFSFEWRTGSTTFSSLFMCLTATSWMGGEAQYPNKFLNLSSLQWRMNSLVEFVAYNSVIYGQRIAPEYFLPGISMIHAQDSGNVDNIFMGGAVRFFLPWNVKIVTDIYLDDFTIMKFLAGSFNTRFKAAFDLNAQWAPQNSPLENLSLGYTAVMPYTYTHNPEFIDDTNNTKEYADVRNLINQPNYSDATHMGAPLGTSIGPNSDKIQLKARFLGPEKSLITSGISFLRHGNASEGYDLSKYPYLAKVTQGSIFDAGYDTSGSNSNLFESVRFLDQKVIEKELQISIGGQIPFEYTGGTLTPQVTLTGEWYWNRNVISGNDGFKPYLSMGLDWSF